MMKPLSLIPADTKVDFLSKRVMALGLSLLLIAVSFAGLITQGLNFGIDFTGGSVIEIRVNEAPDLGDLRSGLESLELGSMTIQEFGAPTDLMIRLGESDHDQQESIAIVKDHLRGVFGAKNIDFRRVEYVGPQVGGELIRAGLLAVGLALAGILMYVSARFEWPFGVAAILALLHDTILTLGLFAWTQMAFDLSTLAAILMIAGYSINDTVVVFDRVREVMRKYKKRALPEILNMALNQTLGRTVMTSLTTLLALGALWILGGAVIQSFINALIFGIVVGTYSSIFIAAPILLLLGVRVNKNAEE